MSEDEIIINIDDSQLTNLLVKMDLLEKSAVKTIGRGAKFTSALPSVNRELRVLLGRIPGMREAVQLLFRAKRLERGLALKKLGEGSEQLFLSILATAIILIQTIDMHQKRVERTQKEYERLLRRSRGWTQEELVRGRQEWENYLKGFPP